jgi:putative lipoprotein
MTTARMTAGLVAVVTVALLAAGCGSDDPGGVTDGAAVEGTIWTLEELDSAAVPDGVEVTLEYDGETISGSGGCNRYSGGATFDAGAVTFDSEVVSTMMACDEPASGVEQRYLDALRRAAGFVVSDGTLTISDADGEPLLVFTSTE